MDECTVWEINDIISNLPFMDRNLWETARLNAYVVAQVNSRKHITQQDICKFKWEDKNAFVKKDESNYEISTEEINRLKELSTKFEGKQWQEIK
jgi:hypothetical protein